ncbi:MAG: adenylyltransferase/cytidyltransferase family protein [Gemmatimonadales bacterium]
MSTSARAASTRGKIVSLDEAVRWRGRLDGPLVFTNGVFDLLHPGHVEYLEAARDLGSHLLVAVNTDRSALSLAKGPARPVADQSARARVVAGLASVDRVVLFDEPTPLEIITTLRPDVLAKGGDYAADAIVGSAEVRAAGGRVVVVPLAPGYSSTALVERCRASS